MWVSNIYDTLYGQGNILSYAHGSTTAGGSVPDPNIFSGRFVTCDKKNKLWYSYLDYEGYVHIATYDGKKIVDSGAHNIPYSGGIRIHGSTIAIMDQYLGIEFFKASCLIKKACAPYRTIGGFGDPIGLSYDRPGQNIWVGDAGSHLGLDVQVATGYQEGSIGQGLLVYPVDTFVFPAGNP